MTTTPSEPAAPSVVIQPDAYQAPMPTESTALSGAIQAR